MYTCIRLHYSNNIRLLGVNNTIVYCAAPRTLIGRNAKRHSTVLTKYWLERSLAMRHVSRCLPWKCWVFANAQYFLKIWSITRNNSCKSAWKWKGCMSRRHFLPGFMENLLLIIKTKWNHRGGILLWRFALRPIRVCGGYASYHIVIFPLKDSNIVGVVTAQLL